MSLTDWTGTKIWTKMSDRKTKIWYEKRIAELETKLALLWADKAKFEYVDIREYYEIGNSIKHLLADNDRIKIENWMVKHAQVVIE